MRAPPYYPGVELTEALHEGKMFRVRSYGHKYDACMDTLPKQGRCTGGSEPRRLRNVAVTHIMGSDPARARAAQAGQYLRVI